jgi:hypothetical protein
MKYLKRFEDLSINVSLTISYIHCDSCSTLWKNESCPDKCKFCDGSEIEELSKDEFMDTLIGRSDEDGIDMDEVEKINDFSDFSNGNLYENED